MSFDIVQSSPEASKLGENETSKTTGVFNYPFDQLEVGQSFTAKLEECNWKSLRICVYQRNDREHKRGSGKKFVFVKHDNLKLCEVARIA